MILRYCSLPCPVFRRACAQRVAAQRFGPVPIDLRRVGAAALAGRSKRAERSKRLPRPRPKVNLRRKRCPQHPPRLNLRSRRLRRNRQSCVAACAGRKSARASAHRRKRPRPHQSTAASPQSRGSITEDQLRKQFVGKDLFLRGGYLDNTLTFNEHGVLIGHSPQGSYTLSGIRIDKVRLHEAQGGADGRALRIALSGRAALRGSHQGRRPREHHAQEKRSADHHRSRARGQAEAGKGQGKAETGREARSQRGSRCRTRA